MVGKEIFHLQTGKNLINGWLKNYPQLQWPWEILLKNFIRSPFFTMRAMSISSIGVNTFEQACVNKQESGKIAGALGVLLK